MPSNPMMTRTRVLRGVTGTYPVVDNGRATESSHATLWVALGLGIGLSLAIAIMSAVTRNHQPPPEPREPPWVTVQVTEQINDLKDEVAKLKEAIQTQQVEIQNVWREVLTAQSQVQEIKSPKPVDHGGANVKVEGEK